MTIFNKHKTITCMFIKAKPTFDDGEFQVEYKGSTAVLFWPKAAGDFTKQAIQKKLFFWRRKRAISECEGDCVEEEVPLDQTSHITDIEPGRQYGFRLVLYDGDVVVQSLENPVRKDKEGNTSYKFVK